MKRQAIVDREKIFENTCSTKELYPEYVKDSYKLPRKKNGQKIRTLTSPKKIHRWHRST